MGRREEQGEAPVDGLVDGLEDAGRQRDDAVDQLAKAEVGNAGIGRQEPALPPVEGVGGQRGVEQERLEVGEGA